MADRLDELVQETVRAGAVAGKAWVEAANKILVSWLDMADVEGGETGFNEEIVLVGPQVQATELSLGEFSSWDGDKLPADKVMVEPETIPVGAATPVRIWIEPPGSPLLNTPSGTYTGSLLRASDDTVLVDGIVLYVVGDVPPPSPPPPPQPPPPA